MEQSEIDRKEGDGTNQENINRATEPNPNNEGTYLFKDMVYFSFVKLKNNYALLNT